MLPGAVRGWREGIAKTRKGESGGTDRTASPRKRRQVKSHVIPQKLVVPVWPEKAQMKKAPAMLVCLTALVSCCEAFIVMLSSHLGAGRPILAAEHREKAPFAGVTVDVDERRGDWCRHKRKVSDTMRHNDNVTGTVTVVVVGDLRV